jgi:16S rRNA (guanine966-N2)-methyltransferase
MRVIAGEFGGRRLRAPDGVVTRPTTDRVRESMFNSLGSMGVIEGGRVLDLFAGTGALGIEALSRGAAEVTFVERDPAALAALGDNIADLGLEDRAIVVPGDARRHVADSAGSRRYDLALVDPPYGFEGWPGLLVGLDASVVTIESGATIAVPPGWRVVRERRYGGTLVMIIELSHAGRAGEHATPAGE